MFIQICHVVIAKTKLEAIQLYHWIASPQVARNDVKTKLI
jgi:hypothetical protein